MKLRAKHAAIKLFLPLLLALDQRITWRLCLFLILGSVFLLGGIGWLSFGEWSVWNSFLYFMALTLIVPLLFLQLINRLFPQWVESITFKYLAIFGLVMAWLSTMSGRATVAAIFRISPGEFTSALTASTFLAMGTWVALIGTLASLLLQAGMIFASARSHHRHRCAKSASLSLQMITFGTVFVAMLATFLSLNGILSESGRQLIAARIAWDIDLVPAPEACLPEKMDDQKSNWRVFPRSVGESETLLVRGLNDLPDKPFWKFTKEERERFSTFDTRQVACGIKEAPLERLKATENEQAAQKRRREEMSYLWGIAPIARIVVQRQ
ncbi:MAG: hypothetical protein WC023_03750 [Rhodocyclaceae bacterium]